MKNLICALALLGCSSQSTNEAPSLGGAAGAATGGAAGSVATGGLGGSAGAATGGAAGSVATGGLGGSAGAATGGAGGTTVTPACTAQEAITKLALSKVTWVWQSYSDQKLATNQCIACAASPCGTSCSMAPVALQWDKPAPGELSPYGDATCDPTPTKVGTCGGELTCNLTPKFVGYLTVTPVPTATGWKLSVGSAKAGADWTSFGSACGSSFIDGQVLGTSLTAGMAQAFEVEEFPCP
jgi:hypothetical protein